MGHSHAMTQPPRDGRFHEIGRQEGKRYRHVDLPNAAPLALGDASDLILPGYLVRPVIAKFKKVTLAYAREIMEEFRASMTATLLRILNENSFPILVVCHGKDRRRWFRRADISLPDALPISPRDGRFHEIGRQEGKRYRHVDLPNAARSEERGVGDVIRPGYLVRPVIEKFKKVTLAYAREIMEEFRASMTAPLLIILNENSFPILVVCHGKDRRR